MGALSRVGLGLRHIRAGGVGSDLVLVSAIFIA